MKFYQIALAKDDEKWLKARFQVKTDAELQIKLEQFIKNMVVLNQCPIKDEGEAVTLG